MTEERKQLPTRQSLLRIQTDRIQPRAVAKDRLSRHMAQLGTLQRAAVPTKVPCEGPTPNPPPSPNVAAFGIKRRRKQQVSRTKP